MGADSDTQEERVRVELPTVSACRTNSARVNRRNAPSVASPVSALRCLLRTNECVQEGLNIRTVRGAVAVAVGLRFCAS